VKIVGVDSSEAMLEIAKNRLHKYKGNFQIFEKDINSIQPIELPTGTYQTVFSVQVLHELNKDLRRNLFKKVYELLETDGQFLIMDRIKTDLNTFEKSYQSLWKGLETTTDLKSASDFESYKERIKNKEDAPGSLEEYSSLYKEAGLRFAILHLHFDRAVMVGVKK
jgi:tRNA (cmo5U34)-methyltransferase